MSKLEMLNKYERLSTKDDEEYIDAIVSSIPRLKNVRDEIAPIDDLGKDWAYIDDLITRMQKLKEQKIEQVLSRGEL